MAALYLHNAIFIPESSESSPSPSRTRPHSRTYSSGTLRTLTTDLSHPTEPLLHSDITTSGSLAYQDLLNRQPSYPDGTQSDWDMSLSLDGDPTSAREKRGHWEELIRRRLKAWRAVKVVLEVILGAWAIYNTVRYFIAYTIYSSTEGQATALALGTSTAVSFAFLLCEAAVAGFQSQLIAVHVPLRSLLILRTVFLYVTSFFLTAPSIVNLALTIIWRHSHYTELDADSRCHLDIDIAWSIDFAKSVCDKHHWTSWLALAIFRVAFTLVLSASLLITTSQYNITRRPSHYTSHRHHRHRRRRDESRQEGAENTASSSVVISQPSPSTSNAPSHPLRHPSHSTVASHATLRQNTSTDRRSVRTSQASSTLDPPLSAISNQSSSQHTCEDDPQTTSDHFNPSLVQQRLTDAIYHSPSTSFDPSMRDDHELNNFVDRFRMLVSQIARETEEAVEYARPDTYVTEVGSDSESDTDSDSRRSPEFFMGMVPSTLGYDEFGRPYPPEDHVRILNGYIRRMPTIESLGSREIAHREHDRIGSLSIHTLSRPPTRAMSDFTGSDPPSRSNSLSLNVTALASGSNGPGRPHTPGANSASHQSASDAGEWTGDRDRVEQESPVAASDAGRSGSQRSQRSSRPSISRSTFSYYTAASGAIGNGNGSVSSPSQTPSSGGFVSLPDDPRSTTS